MNPGLRNFSEVNFNSKTPGQSCCQKIPDGLLINRVKKELSAATDAHSNGSGCKHSALVRFNQLKKLVSPGRVKKEVEVKLFAARD